MPLPPHLESVPRSGRETQAHRQSPAVAQDSIAPDEYPTFTRPSSPELDESKRYTDDAPKRKRMHPWSSRRDSNSESGDDCDRPLARRLSRKASTVLQKFTPQRTRSNSSSARAQGLTEEPEETKEHLAPVAKRRQVSAERRRSSLQKLKEFVKRIRKDSAGPTKTFLPAPPLDQDDLAMGMTQTYCPGRAPSPAGEDLELIYMTGNLSAPAPEDRSRDQNENISLEPLLNSNLTESKRRKASTGAGSLDPNSGTNAVTAATSIDVDMNDGRADGLLPPASLTGYSSPPTPKNRRARHYPYNALPNFPNLRDTFKREFILPSKSPRRDVTAALSTRHITPWDPPSTTSDNQHDSTSTIGVLPSLSSENTIAHISIPTYALPTTATSSTGYLHTPSLLHSPESHPMRTDQCSVSSATLPTAISDEASGSTFAPPRPDLIAPPPSTSNSVTPGFILETEPQVPAGCPPLVSEQRNTLHVPDLDTRPSTATDSTFEGGELRLRRSGSLRRDATALEGMEGLEGYEYVQKALGWSGSCGCGIEGCECEEMKTR